MKLEIVFVHVVFVIFSGNGKCKNCFAQIQFPYLLIKVLLNVLLELCFEHVYFRSWLLFIFNL